MEEINSYKTKLEEEKKILENQLKDIGVVDKTGDWTAVPESEMNTQEVQDEADMADRSEDFNNRSSKLDVLEERLRDINDALEKIDSGSYGVCEVCNNKIEKERLDANTSSRTCISCLEKIV